MRRNDNSQARDLNIRPRPLSGGAAQSAGDTRVTQQREEGSVLEDVELESTVSETPAASFMRNQADLT